MQVISGALHVSFHGGKSNVLHDKPPAKQAFGSLPMEKSAKML